MLQPWLLMVLALLLVAASGAGTQGLVRLGMPVHSVVGCTVLGLMVLVQLTGSALVLAALVLKIRHAIRAHRPEEPRRVGESQDRGLITGRPLHRARRGR